MVIMTLCGWSLFILLIHLLLFRLSSIFVCWWWGTWFWSRCSYNGWCSLCIDDDISGTTQCSCFCFGTQVLNYIVYYFKLTTMVTLIVLRVSYTQTDIMVCPFQHRIYRLPICDFCLRDKPRPMLLYGTNPWWWRTSWPTEIDGSLLVVYIFLFFVDFLWITFFHDAWARTSWTTEMGASYLDNCASF